MRRKAEQPATAWHAAGVFFLACAAATCSSSPSFVLSQLCALAALLAAAWAFLCSRAPALPFSLWTSAALLGVARSPVSAAEPCRCSRPALLVGRVTELDLPSNGRWRGTVTHLRRLQPDGSLAPLDHADRSLAFESPHGPIPPGELLLAGILENTVWGVQLRKASWTPWPGTSSTFLESWSLRSALRRRFAAVLPPEEAGLACALLLGELRYLDAGLQTSYRRFGLLHILAVSGFHFWLWDALLRRFLPGPAARLRVPLLVALAVLAGLGPSVIRALTAVLLRDWMRWRRRRVRGWNLWAAALWVEVLVFAPRPLGYGFLLSYGATAALLFTTPSISLPGLGAFRASAAASFGSAPFLHHLQGTVEPWSVVLTPFAGALLPLRLCLSWLLLLPGPAGSAFQLVWLQISRLENAALDALAGLPWSPLPLTTWSTWRLAALCSAALLALRPGKKRPRWGAALLALGLAGHGAASGSTIAPGLCALPVGHGLAVIVAGERRTLLFDFGSEEHSPRRLVDRLLFPELARRRWPLPRQMVLSHDDHDHVSGVDLLRRRHGGEIHACGAGVERWLPGFEPWRVRLLGLRESGGETANSGGVAVELRCGEQRWLLLGDPFGYALRDLVPRLEAGPIAGMLLPHHGLTTDGLPEILDHVRPQEVWISCGSEDLPLPALPLVERRGIPARTTLSGALHAAIPCHQERSPASAAR